MFHIVKGHFCIMNKIKIFIYTLVRKIFLKAKLKIVFNSFLDQKYSKSSKTGKDFAIFIKTIPF